MRFEWDDSKAERNLRKHGVRLSDAVGAFVDPHGVEFADEQHSSDTESRYAVIGLAAPGLLYVVFTERQPGVIRILHARRADKRIVRIYEGEEE